MAKFNSVLSDLGQFQRVLLLSTAVLVSACAAFPDLGITPESKSTEAYAASDSLSAPVVEWPSDEWWTSYGDEQLNALIAEALAGSPSLAEAETRLRQAQAVAQQAGAGLLPQVSGQSSVSEVKQSYNNGVPAAVVPKGWNDSGQASLNFSYEFDFWGKNRAALAAAISSAEAARADQAQARLTLATAVASAYAELAQLHADREAAEDAVLIRTRTVGLLTERLSRGLENQGAVKQAEAGRASAEAQLAAVNEQIGLTSNRIAALLGAGPDRGLAIDPPKARAMKSFGLPANLKADLIGRRPDIAAARLRAEGAAERVKAAKAEFYPNVNLSAVIGVQSARAERADQSGFRFWQRRPRNVLADLHRRLA
jgi:NodT family efflux transporter outer membrane factor (OMF) lipoprotein